MKQKSHKQKIRSWSHGSAVVAEEAWMFIWSSEKKKEKSEGDRGWESCCDLCARKRGRGQQDGMEDRLDY